MVEKKKKKPFTTPCNTKLERSSWGRGGKGTVGSVYPSSLLLSATLSGVGVTVKSHDLKGVTRRHGGHVTSPGPHDLTVSPTATPLKPEMGAYELHSKMKYSATLQ